MKKILSINQAGTSDVLLLVLRVGVAMLMLTHGLPKMMALVDDGPVQFPPVLGLSPETSLLLAVGAEVFCSVLLLTGTATRLAVVPLMATMLVAVFLIHSADPFVKKELGIIYLLIYTTLLIGGSGKYSVDYALQRKAGKEDRAAFNTQPG